MSWQGPLTLAVWSFICPTSQASHTPPSRHCFPGFRPYPPGRGRGQGALTIVPQPWRAQRPFPVTGLSLHHLLHPLPADARPGTPKWKSWLFPSSLPNQAKQHLSPAFTPGAFTIVVKGTPVQGCLPEGVTLVLISTLLALPGPQQVSLCCLRGGLEAGLSTAATRSHPPPENALMAHLSQRYQLA